jgi:SprT protein
MPADTEILARYMPEPAISRVYEGLKKGNIQLTVSRSRKSKLGDFRPGTAGKHHRISVNGDLNPFHFLIVFVHEQAHALVHDRHGNKVMPHGQEWKEAYRILMQPYLEQHIFPDDIARSLKNYLLNAKAINGTDLNLTRVLARYDKHEAIGSELETLPEGALFRASSGRVFRKLDRRRKRFKCLCMLTGRLYLFNPIARVERLDAID